MTAVRLALEREDKVVQVMVLCAACVQALVEDLDPGVRRWANSVNGTVPCQACPVPRRRRLRRRSG